VSALVAKDYQPELFSEKMDFIVNHPEKAAEIGNAGKKMGLKNFNYEDLGGKLKAFFLSLN
ncbi:MAG: hypothetical protein AAF573_13590, partial [Bacteroidota bacterium]